MDAERPSPETGDSVWARGAARLGRAFTSEVAGQIGLVLLAWVWLCSVQWSNDGLWFQGDSPRHALHGLFWKDFLTSGSLDPKGYALSYYARYPALSPTAYPPVFYLVEAVAFSVLGPSAYVAKGLVLASALIASMYVLAWFRRWLGPECGWMAALFPVLPGMVIWSNGVMLNVPGLAVGMAALYHGRDWLERPSLGRAVVAGLLVLLTVGTYYPSAVVLPILGVWLLVRPGTWSAIPKIWRLIVVGALCLLPLLLVAIYWAPTHLAWVIPSQDEVGTPENWTYYARRLCSLVSWHLVFLSAVGSVAGLLLPRWRRETILLLLWSAVTYVLFSMLQAKETRYVLPMVPALLGLATIGLMTLLQGLSAADVLQSPTKNRVVLAAVLPLLAYQCSLARREWVPRITGVGEVAEWLAKVAPDDAYFYDGHHSSLFIFHVRAGDPEYRRRVLTGHKLLYASALVPWWKVREFATSPKDIEDALRNRSGCRWLLIEEGRRSDPIPATRRLRDWVRRPDSPVDFVSSTLVCDETGERLDLYRLRGPIKPVADVVLPFPILGDKVEYRAQPIATRSIAGRPRPRN